ncbi:probable gmp synthase [glutamine-hydrolyzing] [Phtheirospermum japonicum]|uniref:Probable gmp synthase [glutamine-hydrolyzing] n=1 Tax=Phtheirospermum japonicum TaxID=374723 RepID=A0A830BI64_9LAMI|nr:probable gmp synthase [glutamine-hydrolyzing] [Phtheirospermum japonicum]
MTNNISREKDITYTNNKLFSKNLKKIYPIGLQRTCSALSLSSLSLSLSQNSTDSSLTDYSSPLLDQKILSALRLIVPAERKDVSIPKIVKQFDANVCNEEGTKRCNWITKNSDKVYVQFHDECWGVPVYDDNRLFELLAMCGMLMDFNWTEILKRRELFREAFGGFDSIYVSKMDEKEIIETASNKELNLAESRVRCIVDNAKCITKVASECGSFSSYMWEYVSYKPVINRFKYTRNVPLRSPKAEIISKDLVRRGFRFVGPVIVYSFMQAAGMTVDHLVDCFRYEECVNLAERPWRHV